MRGRQRGRGTVPARPVVASSSDAGRASELPPESDDATELQRVTDGNIRGLPNSFQTNGQVLSALLANQQFGRPDDYQAMLPTIYRDIDAADIDAAARQYLSPEDLAIIVVGDRSQIDEQLKTLGMEIEYLEAASL